MIDEKYYVVWNLKTEEMLTRVAAERVRQRKLLAEGKIRGDVSGHEVSNGFKLAVAMEEVGEVAREIMELSQIVHDSPAAVECRQRLQTELIQLAAVAVAWAESLEVAV